MSAHSSVQIDNQVNLIIQAIHRDKKIGYDDHNHEFKDLSTLSSEEKKHISIVNLDEMGSKIEDFVNNHELTTKQLATLEKEIDKETQVLDKEMRSIRFKWIKGKESQNEIRGFRDNLQATAKQVIHTVRTQRSAASEKNETWVAHQLDQLIDGFSPDNRLGRTKTGEFVVFTRGQTKAQAPGGLATEQYGKPLEIQEICNEVRYFIEENEALLTKDSLNQLNGVINTRCRLLEYQKKQFFSRDQKTTERAIDSLTTLHTYIENKANSLREASEAEKSQMTMKTLIRGFRLDHRVLYNSEKQTFVLAKRCFNVPPVDPETITMDRSLSNRVLNFVTDNQDALGRPLIERLQSQLLERVKYINEKFSSATRPDRKERLRKIREEFTQMIGGIEQILEQLPEEAQPARAEFPGTEAPVLDGIFPGVEEQNLYLEELIEKEPTAPEPEPAATPVITVSKKKPLVSDEERARRRAENLKKLESASQAVPGAMEKLVGAMRDVSSRITAD